MAKKKSKKTRRLAFALYPSGIVGKGKRKVGVVRTTLTPKQFERRWYGSEKHFRTEAALVTKQIPKGAKVRKKGNKLIIKR